MQVNWRLQFAKSSAEAKRLELADMLWKLYGERSGCPSELSLIQFRANFGLADGIITETEYKLVVVGN